MQNTDSSINNTVMTPREILVFSKSFDYGFLVGGCAGIMVGFILSLAVWAIYG